MINNFALIHLLKTKMADADLVSQTLNDTVNATLNNATAQNGTAMGRAVATPQGLLVAYCSLVLMALIPIFFGSFRSIGHKKRQKVCNYQM